MQKKKEENVKRGNDEPKLSCEAQE
jgi:hypothetical protein